MSTAFSAALERYQDGLASRHQQDYDAAVEEDERRDALVCKTLDKLNAIDDCVLCALLDDTDGYFALVERLEKYA